MILFGMLTFSFFNWDTVEVNLWENLVLETKVPVLVIVAFLLGLVPMWLYHRSVKWSLDRRVRSLEASIKSNALAHRHSPAASEAAPGTSSVPVGKPVDSPVDNPVDSPIETGAKAEDSLNVTPRPTGDKPA